MNRINIHISNELDGTTKFYITVVKNDEVIQSYQYINNVNVSLERDYRFPCLGDILVAIMDSTGIEELNFTGYDAVFDTSDDIDWIDSWAQTIMEEI